jgi:hypothetical protein
LDESRGNIVRQIDRSEGTINNTFDHKEKDRDFTEVDLVLLWDKRREKPGMHKKSDGLWTGPYKIISPAGTTYFNLGTMEGEALKLTMNALHIKCCTLQKHVM